MLTLAWAVYIAAKLFGASAPSLPWASGVPLLQAKGGDLMVHMTGITAFLVLGFMRQRLLWIGLAAFSSGIIMVSNRGGMVAFVLGVGLAWLLRPRGEGVGSRKLIYAFVWLLVLGAIIGPMVELKVQGGSRDVSVEQLVENVKSVFGSLGLRHPRRHQEVAAPVVDRDRGLHLSTAPTSGPGKGFGINLAESDGFTLGEADDGLRSPHNGHLTMLARAGVPGLALWLLVHIAWFAGMMRAWAQARFAGQRRWMALYAWLSSIWLAALINASFDVFLEGPMGGIWLWCVMGAGIAAIRLRHGHPALLDATALAQPRASGAPDVRPDPPPDPCPASRSPRRSPPTRRVVVVSGPTRQRPRPPTPR